MTVYPPKEDSHLLAKVVLEKDLEGKKCLDMGTGTGIIAEKMVDAGAEKVVAVDLNPEAVEEAKERLGKYDNVEVKQSDLFENIQEKDFDFIAFNPPYLPGTDLDLDDICEEEIWKGGENGEEFTEDFLEASKDFLSENGAVYFVVSSLSNFKVNDYDIVDTKKLWFEDLYVLKTE